MRTIIPALAIVLFSLPASAADSLTPAACEGLKQSLRLPNTTVTSAQPTAGGQFTPPGARTALRDLPAFCRVALTIKPSADSDIKSEVWLPMTGWNGKFLQVGNGAWGGSIQYGALADGLRRGYAAASTDTGHTGTDASFAVGHPEKLIDFGYRAVHETAVQGKATVRSLYGSAPRFSYFNGCSGGGRQSFMEAQRFPEDFDAIIAGAPGYNRTDGAFQSLGAMQATHQTPRSFIPASKYPLIHQAAINACDGNDGLKDGLITDPRSCRFDPAVLACKGGTDAADCLTAEQVVAAKRIYAPVINPASGEEVFPGLEPGSELHWGAIAGEQPHAMYNDLLRFIVHQDPKWDYRSLDLAKDLERARKADGGVLAATSTDLSAFVKRGGKLLIYHGWEDQNISPRGSVNYYTRLQKAMGAGVSDAVRLFMVPGMGHCSGGDGPDQFDAIAALEQWREHAKAPDQILASKVVDGRVTRTRPLCPYPQVARYKGTGSIDKAENFACQAP